MQNEKSFNTGELTLSYLEGGTGSPMVLLHGLTSSHLEWSPILPQLMSRWHVYNPDLRGHGQSGRAPDHRYGNADYARDVIALLKFIGEPAVLMGHSLGAMVGIVTAYQYPEGVRALVLLDPPLVSYTDGAHTHPQSAQWFATVAEVMQDDPPYETVVTRLRARMPGAPDEQIKGTAAYLSSVAPDAAETALRDQLWQGVDLPRALQSIRCPTLMIHADWDRGGAMRTQDVEFFTANCPSATVVRIPGSDHGMKMQEQPEIVLQHLRAFLQPA